MCIAIVKKPGIQIPRSNLTESWQHNPDGAGYAFVKDGEVVIRKGYMKLKEFLDAYEVDEATNPESNFLVHFRITSQGGKGSDNTHPFPIEDGALIHNGTLTGTGSTYGVGPSDTAKFANMFSKHLTYSFVENNKFKLNNAISGSKICMLYKDNTYQIINEADGLWEDDVWYSNRSFKCYSPMTMYNDADSDDEYADWWDGKLGESIPWQ